MAKLWARPVHGVLILAEGGGGGGGGGGPPWHYARSAPACVRSSFGGSSATLLMTSCA